MKREFFKNHGKLSDYMIDMAQRGFYTVAVLFYEDAIKLTRELMSHRDIDVESLDVQPEIWFGYDREYYVSLADDMVLAVEPAYMDGVYLSAEAGLTLIDYKAHAAIIKDLPAYECREIYIGDCDDDEEDTLYTRHYSSELLFEDLCEYLEMLRDAGEIFDLKGLLDYLFE